MPDSADEETMLRLVALQNAQSILLARQQAEDALRRSERELVEFFENATVGLHWAGPDGIILRVNGAELEMLGYARDEYVGHHIAEFHVDRDVIDDILRRLHTGEELRDHAARMRCKDRSIKHVLINSNVFWEDGKFVHSCCFTRDVTYYKEAEETQARLAAIVDSSQDAIVGKTLEGRIVSWNSGAERLFGYAGEEAIGRLITLIIPPDRLDEEKMILEKLGRGERINHYETVRVSKLGRPIDVSVTISPIRDKSGRIIGASKIARDITARVQSDKTRHFLADASTALAELADFESTLHKVAGLAVPFFSDWCAVDVLEADGSVRRLAVMHADPEKIRLVRWLDRKYPVLTTDPAGVGKVIRTGVSEWSPAIPDELLTESGFEEEYLRTVRSLQLRSYLCVPLKLPAKVLGALTFVMAESGRSFDLDDVRSAEDLAHRAAIAIENASLMSALQDSDRRKDEFLAMLAHELRNPLAPMRNALEILHVKGSPDPELIWARDVIDRQMGQMTRLVDDLLDVSRISRGKIDLHRERVALASLVKNAVEVSRPLIDSRDHELLVEIPSEAIYLDADPTRLVQVLLNLLNNAAKYMNRGGRIWLTAERAEDQAVIRVKDTGIGIPSEMLRRIFEIFAQGDHTLERTEGGLGIGLTLVERLVALHGGTIEARSDGPDKGSEFIVRLPLAHTTEPAKKRPSEPAPSGALRVKRRILVVDDNQDSAMSLAMLLRLMGNEVHMTYDGLAAIAAVSEFRPDLVLMDIGLPKLNGYDAARRIRAEHGDRIALIALTGWGQEDDRRQSKEAGFDQHLTKPVEAKVLQALLAEPPFREFVPAT